MKIVSIIFILILIGYSTFAFGQEGTESKSKNELMVTDQDLIIIFTTAILIVIGIFIYMARNTIKKQKTDYEKEKFLSQENRDFEKYHSDWTDDFEDLASKKLFDDEEFRTDAKELSLPDYYEILGVQRDATKDEIKNRYRQLAKELHPDKSKSYDSDKMAEINKAYEILSDRERRIRYDKYLNVS